jgi:rRNA maturation RNase YbeY
MNEINFFNEDIDFALENSTVISNWIAQIIESNSFTISQLNYIFCSDNYLLEINRTYLSHDYLTDIITFDNSDEANVIEADIFISIDRVRDNAQNLGTNFSTEFNRVLIHGILHLLGWDDKSQEDKAEMREKEEACLSLLRI